MLAGWSIVFQSKMTFMAVKLQPMSEEGRDSENQEKMKKRFHFQPLPPIVPFAVTFWESLINNPLIHSSAKTQARPFL